MNWFEAGRILAMGQQQTPPGTQPDPRAQMLSFVVPLAAMLVILYLVMIRPQSQKAKQHAQMLKSIKAGDKVITTGGMVGVVVNVKEKTISLRSADSKFEVTKSAIAEVTERAGQPSED